VHVYSLCGGGFTFSAVNGWPAPVAAVSLVLLGHSAMTQIKTNRTFVVVITGINYIFKYVKIENRYSQKGCICL